MARTGLYACKHCLSVFRARVSARQRGHARYCSKSCKAYAQNRRGKHFDKEPPK